MDHMDQQFEMTQQQQHQGPSLESQLATLSQFGEQLTRLGERDAATATDGFDVEFRALLALDQRVRSNPDEFYTALLGSHAAKNRYRDVLPNEGTRVVLRPLGAGGDGAYINANYIDGPRLFGTPCSYIATQAPLRHTVCDFWRMVVEHGTSFIVMLTAEVEAGKSKADRYWPAAVGDTVNVGAGLRVTMLTESAHDETTFRVLRVQSADGSVTRDVLHMQHTRWPDMGVPRTTAGIAAMIGTIARSSYATRAPIVVHCSGGVGRTGVFITIHVAMALFQLGLPVSVPRIVQFLKYCRSGMVQRRDQYQFCYYGALREMERMVRSAHAVTAGRPTAAHDPAGFDPLQPPLHVRQQQQYDALQRQRGAHGHGPMPRLPQYNPLHPAAVTARSFNVLVPDVAPPAANSGYDEPQPQYPPRGGGGGGGAGMALPLQQNHQQQQQQPYGVIYTKQYPSAAAAGVGAGQAGRAGGGRGVAFSDGTTPGSVFSVDGSAVDVTLPSVLVPSGDVDEALAAIRRENQRQRSSRRGPSIGLVGSP